MSNSAASTSESLPPTDLDDGPSQETSEESLNAATSSTDGESEAAPPTFVAPAAPQEAPQQPQESPLTPTSTVSTAAPAAPQPRAEVAIVAERLANYKAILMSRGNTEPKLKIAASELASVVRQILADPSDDVLTVVWTFFIENADGVCQDMVALQGTNQLDVQMRFKVDLVYTLFRKAVTGLDVSNPKVVQADLVRSRLNCPGLLLYLQRKARGVVSMRQAS